MSQTDKRLEQLGIELPKMCIRDSIDDALINMQILEAVLASI